MTYHVLSFMILIHSFSNLFSYYIRSLPGKYQHFHIMANNFAH